MAGTDSLTTVIDRVEPAGLRVVCTTMPGPTEFCGLIVNAGSRDELTAATHGLAHFVEHTIFKGTGRRSDSYVLNRMEQVGGELNAYTTKEETTLYAAMPAGNHARACALIGELASESVFPERKLDLEREVICDEIDSYLDSPAESVYDFFDEIAYAGNPLAHNILGTKESVAAIDSAMCRDYLRRAFAADNAVYFYLGPESPSKVMAAVRRAFSALPARADMSARIAPQVCGPENRLTDRGSHQCHTLMGVPVGGLHSERRHAVALASNILGGPGMNALLNVELRERRGLVYSVETSTALMSDCGMMTVYFGCDHHDLRRCSRLVESTLNRFASSALSERRLAAWKRQYLGQLTLSLDNKEQLALNCGRAVLHGLPVPSFARTAEKIASITPEELREVAEKLAQAPLRTLTLA